MNKEIKNEELNNTNGGGGSEDTPSIVCRNCGELYSIYSAESRNCGTGCESESEYKCPSCGTWQKF